MDPVIVAKDAEGLPVMLGDLIRSNLERKPELTSILRSGPGRVNIHVTDLQMEVGLVFTGASVSIGSPLADPQLSFTCDSDTLMALTAVPLRLGMPDPMTKEGRRVAGWLKDGTLRVKGLPTHLRLMTRMQRLFSVL